MNKKILICAGEASGDLLGSQLIYALKRYSPEFTFLAMGGKEMGNSGATIVVNSDQLAVVGAFEILTHIKPIWNAWRILKKILLQKKPDLVILIDYPGFNLRFAKQAKKLGIKVLFYVSPQIWAWRYRRIYKIKKYVDHMAVLFPFEEKIYQKENIPVSFVGHPLGDMVKPEYDREKIFHDLKLNSHDPVIALMPGSRISEITRLMPIMVETMQMLRSLKPNVQFILIRAPSLDFSLFENYCKNHPITIVSENRYDALSICNAAVVVSGTATLELALLKIPMIIIYKMSAFSYAIGKRLIKVPYIGLCNLVAETSMAKELIQEEVTVNNIVSEILDLLNNIPYRTQVLEKMDLVRQKLCGNQAAEKTAQVVIDLLQ